jgi:type II secretory pathway component PulK
MLLALGAIIVSAVVLVALQASALSQAVSGRESLARARAYWSARAGVEVMVARLERDTLNPDLTDAFSTLTDMSEVARGELLLSTYRVVSTQGEEQVDGPADAHAKVNINRMGTDELLLLEPFMTEDVADSVLDWIDADEDQRELGAEASYYGGMTQSYQPRNAPMRSVQELELVAGVRVEDVRGEDWNLNGVLDSNENDRSASFPDDNADGVLQAGWSSLVTAASVDDVLAASGEARLDLKTAQPAEIVDRLEVTPRQAEAISTYAGTNQAATQADFIRATLAQLLSAIGQGPQPGQQPVPPLNDTQLGKLLDETSMGDPAVNRGAPGKLNVNTAEREAIMLLPGMDDVLADAILTERNARTQGFLTLTDLLGVQGMTRARLAALYDAVTVRSNAFVVTSVGRDERTGVEVEITAVLDRSTIPVVIREVIVR